MHTHVQARTGTQRQGLRHVRVLAHVHTQTHVGRYGSLARARAYLPTRSCTQESLVGAAYQTLL